MKTAHDLIRPRYKPEKLDELLESICRNRKLSEALTNVIIPSFDIKRQQPVFFSSWEVLSYYRTISPSHTVQTALCSQYDHDTFQMFQFAVKKSWGCQLLRKRMIHIAGSQLNYVTEPSRAAEAMCTVTSRECLDLLKRESFPVLMHNLMMIDFAFRSWSSVD